LDHAIPDTAYTEPAGIIDSSATKYSLGESPDISTRIKGVRQAHRLATHGVIEVKSRKHVDSLQWLGQVKDSLLDFLIGKHYSEVSI